MSALFHEFRAACTFAGGRRTLAAVKRGLLRLGVISSDAVATGTATLDATDAERFDADFERLRSRIEASLPRRWQSEPAEADLR